MLCEIQWRKCPTDVNGNSSLIFTHLHHQRMFRRAANRMKQNQPLKPDKILNYSCNQTDFSTITLAFTPFASLSVYYDMHFF